MSGEHPIKQLLFDTQKYWDHEGTPEHVRETFWKIMKCGTIALGAEVYASEIETKLVFHTQIFPLEGEIFGPVEGST